MTDDPLDMLEEEAAREAASDPDQHRREDLRARVHTFAELAAMETVAAEPLLGPLVRRKWRTILVGHTGEGKTTFATRMVGALVTGGLFLGYRATPCRVLVIDVEQDETMAQERVGEAMLGPAYNGDTLAEAMAAIPEAHNAFYCRWTEGIALDEATIDRQVLREVIDEIRPDVILLDPLYKTFMGNPNEPQLAAQVMRFLDGMREEYGFALIMPMHPRKEQQGAATGRRLTKHDAYGGGGWIWGAEMVLGLERMPASQALLSFFKDRSGTIQNDTKWSLEYSSADGFKRLREQLPGGKTATEDLILERLREAPGEFFDREAITIMVDREERTVRNALMALKKDKETGKVPRLEIRRGRAGAYLYSWTRAKTTKEANDDLREQTALDLLDEHDEEETDD